MTSGQRSKGSEETSLGGVFGREVQEEGAGTLVWVSGVSKGELGSSSADHQSFKEGFRPRKQGSDIRPRSKSCETRLGITLTHVHCPLKLL